jgi:hypothetical protein
MIVADYCTIKSRTWLVVADRFTGWVSVKELITILREMFSTFGVAEEMASDHGSLFRSAEMEQFLARWGVRHRTSSEYNPHSNLRAETAVKTAKRLLMTSTGSDGSPIWDKVCQAILQHSNTPVRELNLSPAQLLFGRPIRDFLPVRPGQYSPADTWIDCREKRELALRHKISLGGERWSEHTKPLPDLQPGQHVFIQNQRAVGNLAKRWDKTGVVVEYQDNDKYAVKVDGSGRVTHRNRKYLRSFKPAMQTPALPGRRPDTYISPPPDDIPPVATDAPRTDLEPAHAAPSVTNKDMEQIEQPDVVPPTTTPSPALIPATPPRPPSRSTSPRPAPSSTTPSPPTSSQSSPPPPASSPADGTSSPRHPVKTRRPNTMYPSTDYDLSS